MNQNVQPHSAAWVTFTYVSFSASAFMVAVGSISCRSIFGRRDIFRWAS